MDQYLERLLHPKHLYTASEVLCRPCPVPTSPGVYARYFDAPVPLINLAACHRIDGRALLYVGISPKAPSAHGLPSSRSTLRKRIQTHYRGNAEGSTLRRTLGCLLGTQLGIQLRRVGSGGRYTFTNPGEQTLDRWMDQHAFVTWVETKAPWQIEKKLLSSGPSLPLNIDGNASAEAAALLSAARLKARYLADQLEMVSDSGGPRRPSPQACRLPRPR
jgi:GIY-YIG catalytic domain-containing protein